MNISKFTDIKLKKIQQHSRQENLVNSLTQFNCHQDVNEILFNLHSEMIRDGIEALNTSLFSLPTVLNNQYERREELLSKIQLKINTLNVCKN